MSGNIGQSSTATDTNQAQSDELKQKREEAARKAQEEAGASSDTSASKDASETTKADSQTKSPNEPGLDTQLPGTTNKDSTDPSPSSQAEASTTTKDATGLAKESDSSELGTQELFTHIETESKKLQERINSNPANPTNRPNSAAEHIASRGDTMAFAARQMRIESAQNREEQVRFEDDSHAQAAYQEVQNEAKRLLESGQEDQARELLRQIKDRPEALRSVAEQVKAERLSPQTINLRLSSELDLAKTESPEDMQATQYTQMTREEQKDHTLELMAGLMTTLDESTADFLRNESILSALNDTQKPSTQNDPLNPFEPFLRQDNNPFSLDRVNGLQENLQSPRENFLYGEGASKASDEGLSLLVRHGENPDEIAIQSEIEARQVLRETQIKQRETLLTAQGNAARLAQTDRADQIHLLFDGKGNPLDKDTIKERGSYNSGLSDELEGQYRDLNEFLNRDQSLEAGFNELKESSIGLSAEEQTVRARDFLTENLQSQRETLRALQDLDPSLNSIIRGEDSAALERLTAIDQKIISDLTQDTLEKRTDLMFGLHDQLTESLNSSDYEKGVAAVAEAQDQLESGLYTYQRNELSDKELVNRDLARTPQEDEAIQERISALEKEFETLTDEQLEIVKGNQSTVQDDLEEFKSLNEFVPLGLFEEKGWRVVGGEAEIRKDRIAAVQNHSDKILDGLISQQKNIKESNETMTEANQLERYERTLSEIIDQASSNYQEAGSKAQSDLTNIRRSLEGLDSFYSNTETGLKLARNAAVIAGVTLATGGTGTALVAGGWGATGAGLAAFGAGTAYGAGVSLLANSAEGLSRDINGFNNPYENILSQTWQDTKTSASVAAATATGMTLTKTLSETYKWGRLASSITGAGASGVVSTNITYGLNAAEQKFTTGEVDFDGKKYLKDLLWNTSTSMVGGAIGGKFGQWQDASSSAATKFGLIATEELTSAAADLGLTYARDGEITTEGLVQTFQASITGRAQAHFAQQGSVPKNELAQQIRNQETTVKSSGELPDGVEAQTKVRVEPDGTRKVEVDASEDVMRRAMEGDIQAQKTMLEETAGHARENPIDPQVKQADGTYKAMSRDKYHALRAKQELAMRSVGEAKFAQDQKTSVSVTKQDSKVVLAEMNKQIKAGNYEEVMKLAEANGVNETYRKQFDADYEHNANRNRDTDALEQTSFAKKDATTLTNTDSDSKTTKSTPPYEALDNQITAIKEKGEITTKEIDQLRKQVEERGTLTSKQSQRLSSQLDSLDTSKMSISEKAELAYLTGKINGNAEQRLHHEVDLAISNKYRESGPEAVKTHVKELEPKIQQQMAEVQRLSSEGADNKALAESLGKLHRLSLEMSAIRGSETVGHVARDVNIDSRVKNLEALRTGQHVESLRNPDSSTNAKTEANDFIKDLKLSVEQRNTRENAISELQSKVDQISEGQAEVTESTAKELQNILESIDPKTLTETKVIELNKIIADARIAGIDTSNLSPIRITSDLPQGVQAKNTVKYDNEGNLLSVDSAARHGLVEAARNGNSNAKAIIREEAQAHAKEKPLDPLKTKSGEPMPKEAYVAIRAQRELAMRAKGKALQAQAEGKDVSSVKQGTKEALAKMTEAIKSGNLSEAMRIAEENGVGKVYSEQFGKDYDHNVKTDRTHLEQTSFSTKDKINNKQEALELADMYVGDIVARLQKLKDEGKPTLTDDQLDAEVKEISDSYTGMALADLVIEVKAFVKNLKDSRGDITVYDLSNTDLSFKGDDVAQKLFREVLQDRIDAGDTEAIALIDDAIKELSALSKGKDPNPKTMAKLEYAKLSQESRAEVDRLFPGSTDLQKKHSLGSKIEKIRSQGDLDSQSIKDFFDNLEKIKNKGGDFEANLYDAYKKADGLRPGQAKDVMSGPFAEAEVTSKLLNNSDVTNLGSGSRSIVSDAIFDKNGNAVLDQSLLSNLSANETNTIGAFTLEAIGVGGYAISHNGKPVKVNNGKGLTALTYDSKTGRFKASGKDASVYYDGKSFSAREFDANYDHAKHGTLISEVKADIGTARNKFNKDANSRNQFYSQLAAAKRLGVNPSFIIGKSQAEIQATITADDKTFFKDRISDAKTKPMNLTLKIFDKDHNDITHLF